MTSDDWQIAPLSHQECPHLSGNVQRTGPKAEQPLSFGL
jgi:hypothetical protein